VSRYALAGAVAAYNYIEPTVTDHLDILISFNEPISQTGLACMGPRYRGLGRSSSCPWPAISTPSLLARAQELEIRISETEGSVWTRVLRAEHLVAICLGVGRPKDLIRISQFMEENAVGLSALCQVLGRHKLKRSERPSAAALVMPIHATSRERPVNPGQIVYPDVWDILARKEERRREISRRSFGEKIAMVERLRERLAPLKQTREERRRGNPAASRVAESAE
jgi:hypothetical protein